MACRRSSVAARTATTAPTATSATQGTLCFGMHGREDVRQLPVRGHGEGRPPHSGDQRQQHAERRDRRGDPDDGREGVQAPDLDGGGERRGGGGQAVGAEHRQQRDRDDGVDRQHDAERDRDRLRDRARGVAHFFPERRDPRVAGEGEEDEAGGLEDPVCAVSRDRRQPVGLGVAARKGGRHGDGQAGEDEHDDHPRQRGGAVDSLRVDRGHDDDGGNCDGLLRAGSGVRGEGDRHRRAACDLSDHEAPSGQKAVEAAEPLAAVYIASRRPADRSPRARPTTSRCKRRRRRPARARGGFPSRPPRPRARRRRRPRRRASPRGR